MNLEKVSRGSTLGIVLSIVFTIFFALGVVDQETVKVTEKDVTDNSIWYVLGLAFSSLSGIVLAFWKIIRRYLELDAERDNRLLDIIEKERERTDKQKNKDHS